MTDRVIVYPGALPRSADILQMNKNTEYGLGHFAQAMLGVGTYVAGLACTPTGVASLQVNVAPGSIYIYGQVDATAYGSLGLDTNNLEKQGVVSVQSTLTIAPPSTAGFSQVFLVQVAYSDVDAGATVLPYYNAANPSVPWSGPNNTGASQFTNRQGVCIVALKAGVAATTGTQTTPAADSGYTGLYAITVANGQTQITSPNIVTLASAPFFVSLPNIPTLSFLDARYPQIKIAPANLTFYVNSGTGNDSNSGISPANAFLTIQGAINNITLNYLCTGQVTILVANGSYNGFAVNASFVSAWYIVGNNANPNSVTITATGTAQRGVTANAGTVVKVSGMVFSSYYENATAIHSSLTLINCNYTPPTSYATSNLPAISAQVGGYVLIYGTCSYSGNGYAFASSLSGGVLFLGYADALGITGFVLTLTGTPSFSAFVVGQYCSVIYVYPTAVTFTGTATGPRYSVSVNAIIQTQGGGANYFPGNAAGSAATGGQYL